MVHCTSREQAGSLYNTERMGHYTGLDGRVHHRLVFGLALSWQSSHCVRCVQHRTD